MKFHSTSFIITLHCQGLSTSYNECDYLDFYVFVICHLKSAYLRLYRRKKRHASGFDGTPHIYALLIKTDNYAVR